MKLPDRGVFITGTDTDIGKTAVAAAVLLSLRQAGVDAVPMKPVQTGGVPRQDNRLGSPDLDFCLKMAGMQVDLEEYDLMAPYVYEPACSPHLAAARSGRDISFDGIADALFGLLARRERVVVEGAGGVLVPITGDKMTIDLMERLGLPVILASRPGLGTINHTLLSLRELERRGIPILGVIFCDTKKTIWGEIEEDNIRTIERLGHAPVLGRIPYMEELNNGKITSSVFKAAVSEGLNLLWGG